MYRNSSNGGGYGQRSSTSSFGRGRYSNSRGSGYGGNSRGGRGRRNSFAQKIDYSKYIKKIVEVPESEQYVVTNTVDDFDLVDQLRKNILAKGFNTPTPIQDQSINSILEGKDLIGLAGTGTGKTGAFLIPLINDAIKDRKQRTIILAPTRELAIQIHREFIYLVRNTNVYAALCIGGESMFKQRQNLSRGPQFVIATPGRLLDHVRSRTIIIPNYQNIVLDEVDIMLDMGFVNDIQTVVSQLPENRRMLFFSATLSHEIEKLAQKFLRNPVKISVNAHSASESVDQDVVRFSSKDDKFQKLSELLVKEEFEKVLIFVATKSGTEEIKRKLVQNNIKSESIHGDKRQRERKNAIESFTNNYVSVLVATDVAARGLDIKDVSHVINYDEPNNFETYIHRIGRTGRAGKVGKSLTFVSH
jgi:ATP-dependent RNA helicase RhlE